MNERITLFAGAILGGLGVGIGAFGAHALKAVLTANGRLETFELAVRYQFYHALGLLLIGVLMGKLTGPWAGYASVLMLLGTIIFSGSLYALSLSGIRIWGAVTPIGGVLMIAAWACLAIGIYQKK